MHSNMIQLAFFSLLFSGFVGGRWRVELWCKIVPSWFIWKFLNNYSLPNVNMVDKSGEQMLQHRCLRNLIKSGFSVQFLPL